MKRALFFLLIGAGLLAGIPAQAFWQSRDSNYNIAISAGASYTGPGDVVSGATAWYGLRAYNAAYAATPGLSVNVRRASDNVACDFLVASSGGFGVTTATCNSSTQGGVSYGTFVGSDGTASCTLAGTAAACTGASGTVHVNDVVTGTGLTQPCIVASASNIAPTIEIAGTTNSCGTVSVAVTFTFQVAGFITEWYDQSGNGANVSQATAGTQVQFVPNNGNNIPGATSSGSKYYTQTIAALAQPLTISAIVERTAGFSSAATFFGLGNGCGFANSANTATCFFGTTRNATAADSALHSLTFAISAGSTAYYVDGVSSSPGSPGTNSLTANWQIFAQASGVQSLTGYLDEAGVWPVLFNSTQAGNMHTNQSAYYGTP
jgi:hypothetical protein